MNDMFDLIPGLPHFNQDQQYGSSDQPLYNTTANGNQPALDSQNDTRNSFEYKQDYQQALKLTADDKDDDSEYYVSKGGNKYTPVDNSRKSQLANGIVAYASSFFASNGDWQKAYISSYNAVNDLDSKAKRFAKIDDLENTGHNPMDIQNYIDDGDPKTLIANKGKWSEQGGMLVNDLTGDTRELPKTAAQIETERHNRATEDATGAGSYQKINDSTMFNTKSGEIVGVPGSTGDDGKQYLDKEHNLEIQLNGAGAPITSQRSGEVFVKDLRTGETGWRSGTSATTDPAGRTALWVKDQLDPTNKDSVMKQWNWDVQGQSGFGADFTKVHGYFDQDTKNKVDTNKSLIGQVNGTVHSLQEQLLAMENRGQRPTSAQIKSNIDILGEITPETPKARVEQIMKAIKVVADYTTETANAGRNHNHESTEPHVMNQKFQYEGVSSKKPEGSTASIGGVNYVVKGGQWTAQP